jgi:DNA ligase-1
MRQILFLFIPFLLFASKPELFLLKNYTDQNITGWVMSEKLDGIRAYWDGEKLLTRNGKIINAPKWFTKNFPKFELDGELWSKRADFENISSIVRDKKPSKKWSEIKYYIFEAPNAKGDLFTRLKKIKPFESDILKIIKQIKIKNKEHLQGFLKEVEAKKGEGVVVRDPNTNYINKRTPKALKVKTFQDSECEVLGYNQGKGKFENLVGSIKCKLPNGIVFNIGSGLSNEQRNNPPKIGQQVTFKYKEFTKYGKPRFPVFLRVRDEY